MRPGSRPTARGTFSRTLTLSRAAAAWTGKGLRR
jgi:hypothetical protein